MIACPYCGAHNHDGAAQCHHCRRALAGAAAGPGPGDATRAQPGPPTPGARPVPPTAAAPAPPTAPAAPGTPPPTASPPPAPTAAVPPAAAPPPPGTAPHPAPPPPGAAYGGAAPAHPGAGAPVVAPPPHGTPATGVPPPPGVAAPGAARRQPPTVPAPRRRALSAALAGLVAFVLVAALGTAIWYFGLRPDDESGRPAPAEPAGGQAPGTPNQPADDPGSAPNPPEEPSAPPDDPGGIPARASFTVKACDDTTPRGRCINPSFDRSADVDEFVLWLVVKRADPGKRIVIRLVDAETRQPFGTDNRFRTKEASTTNLGELFTVTYTDGPFEPGRYRYVVIYDGTVVEFNDPPTVTLR